MEIGHSTSAYANLFARPGGQAGADEPARQAAEEEAKAKDPLKDPTSAESRELEQLKQRDREVRAHELAHLAAAGQYAQGGAKFEYQRGPDGGRYAVGGEVSIDTSPVPGDPEATIRKLQAVQRAALAPAEPSGQDRSVASQAAGGIVQARAEASEQERGEATDGASPAAPSQPPVETQAVEATDGTDEPGQRDGGQAGVERDQPARDPGRAAVARYQQTASAVVDQAQAPALELIA